MMLRSFIASIPVLLALSGGVASAQTGELEQSITFFLKPSPKRIALSPVLRPVSDTWRRIDSMGQAPTDDREHGFIVRLQRQSRYFSGEPHNGALWDIRRESLSPTEYDARPRSRNNMLTVEHRLALDDTLGLSLGWRGVKVSNRNANITVGGGNDRLRARDWFMPQATMTYRPAADIAMSLQFRETLRAYSDTGFTGPLGLTRPEFDSLRRALKPETSRKIYMDAQWKGRAIAATISGHRAHIQDRLSFADHAYLPVNVGSASLEGAAFTLRHQVTRDVSWWASYNHARVRMTTGGSALEQQAALGGTLTHGPWRGSVSALRSSVPALTGVGGKTAPWRAEAGIEYLVDASTHPLRLGARITNPSRLASIRLMEDDMIGGVRAIDQARAVMISANMAW